MDTLRILLLMFFQPLVLVLTGTVFMECCGLLRTRAWASPMAGVAVWMFAGICPIMTQTSPKIWALAVMVLVMVTALLRRRKLVLDRNVWATFGSIYLYTLGVMMILPFPGMWMMGGDWCFHFSMAETVWSGNFGIKDLARSPSFAAGSTSGFLLDSGFGAYQIYVAAASASAVTVLLHPLDGSGTDKSRRFWIVFALLSPFFLVHLQNLWPKWIAAGCYVMALSDGLRFRHSGAGSALIASCFWMGSAVAAHESTLLLTPLWLASLAGKELFRAWRRPQMILASLAVLSLTCVLWQAWVVLKFGLQARVSQNPAVTWDQGVSLGTKVWLNIVDSSVGLVFENLWHCWTGLGAAFSLSAVMEAIYYETLELQSWLGATLLTIFGLAIWASWRSLVGRMRRMKLKRALTWFSAAGVSYLLFSLVHPIAPDYGAAQTGLTQLCLFGFAVIATWSDVEIHPSARRSLLRINAALGLVPFAVLSLLILGLFKLPITRFASLIERYANHDSDLWTIRFEHWEPIALTFFPLGFLVLGAGVMAVSKTLLPKEGEPQTAVATSTPAPLQS